LWRDLIIDNRKRQSVDAVDVGGDEERVEGVDNVVHRRDREAARVASELRLVARWGSTS